VVEIVRKYLVDNGYDGLFSEGVCACTHEDLAPCGQIEGNCTAGFKTPCNCGEHDYHIEETKP